jgi:opacity protein-like surface antigen
MRQFMIVAVALAVLLVPAMAQDFPRAEVFGGYQFTHLNPQINASGWNVSATGNVNKWFGVTADFSGAYKSGERLHTYMVGPTFSVRTERITPFAHALFGGATGGGSAFAMAVGGGVDLNASRHLAVRLIQADWLLLRSEGFTNKQNARVSAGIVFRF